MDGSRVLASGTIKYEGWIDPIGWDWITARVFVIEYHPSRGGGDATATVMARELMRLHERIVSPVGSIHELRVFDDDSADYRGEGDLLILDEDAFAAI